MKISDIKKIATTNPLLFCIWIAFVVRMVAVFFSRGIAFGYDHYIYLENAQALVSGDLTFDNFFSSSNGDLIKKGYSLIYLGLNYIILFFCNLFGIYDPESKVFIIGLINALVSLLPVYYVFKITSALSSVKAGFSAGILCSLLWFMPFCCVRALAENPASVFLLAGMYRVVKSQIKTVKYSDDLFTGFIMAVGFSFSYNSLFFIIGVILFFLIRSGRKRALYFTAGALISVFTFEGIVDSIFLNGPFCNISDYMEYSFSSLAEKSGASKYYIYPSILLLIFPIPIGLIMFWGYLYSWKKVMSIFLPFTLYLVFHLIMSYKHERFMITVAPFYIILCICGLYYFFKDKESLMGRKKIIKLFKIYFWAINIPMLVFVTTAYFRKAQVETMLELSKSKSEINSILIENSGASITKSLPSFYFGRPVVQYFLNGRGNPDESTFASFDSENQYIRTLYSEQYFLSADESDQPRFVVFYGDYNFKARLNNIKKIFPKITFVKTLEPSLCDRVVAYFNSENSNPSLHIYQTSSY